MPSCRAVGGFAPSGQRPGPLPFGHQFGVEKMPIRGGYDARAAAPNNTPAPAVGAVLRVGGQNPMAFNTALALALTGVALVALRPRVTLAPMSCADRR